MQNKNDFEIEYINPHPIEYYVALYNEKNSKNSFATYEVLTIKEIKEKYGVGVFFK